MLFTLRISLPDRPGTLGSIATAFGQGGANILALDVVDSEGGFAIDDMVIEAPEGMQMALLLARQVVPDLVVEELRPLQAFQDHMAPLEVAAALSEASGRSAVLDVLIERLPEALRSDWCVVLTADDGRVKVLASSIGAPSLSQVRTSWLPLDGVRRLPPASWMPASWTAGPAARDGQGKFELVGAPVFDGHTVALVGRRSGPQFRNSELTALGLLARIAASCEAGEPLHRAS